MTENAKIDITHVNMQDVLAVILGGGRGNRLFPLTKYRSKPAVPIAAKYRLIDVPISNCINSRIERIFILTQFNSESLNRHILQTYKMDTFRRGFISILAAEQTPQNNNWYQGTADAVRQNIAHLYSSEVKDFLILSGDHLYRMDYYKMYLEHVRNNADITVAVYPVTEDDCKRFGVLKIDENARITEFAEKPADKDTIKKMQLEHDFVASDKTVISKGSWIGSMGVYLFKQEVLLEALRKWEEATDFGKEIIPRSIGKYNIFAHIYNGYWEDIGTIRSWYDCNLRLTEGNPPFQFYDEKFPIYTHPRFLPASKINGAAVKDAVIGEGCIISKGAEITGSLIGSRSMIHENSKILYSIIMGADYFESDLDNLHSADGVPNIGIGENSQILNAIIDKNARIGKNVVINSHVGENDVDGDNFYIREGIVIIPKNGIIPDNAII